MLVLLSANFVKKPRRSFAMPAFFAVLSNKITSPNSENLFRNKPLFPPLKGQVVVINEETNEITAIAELLKNEKTLKMIVKGRRLKTGWDNRYLVEVSIYDGFTLNPSSLSVL